MGSPTQSKILAIAPKFTAFLSVCGSAGIIVRILPNKRRRKKTRHRLLLGMSLCDVLAVVWYFASTWPIPVGTPSKFGNGTSDEAVFWAVGTDATCAVAGFFNQFAVATPLYNLSLAIFYLLVVRFGWKDRRIARIEWVFHAVPWTYAITTAISALVKDLYGPVEWTCWINPAPAADGVPTLSMVQLLWYQAMLFGVSWVCQFLMAFIFLAMYLKMRQLEKKIQSYAFVTNNSNQNIGDTVLNHNHNTGRASARKEFATQGLCYVGAFYVTWLFPTFRRIIQIAELKPPRGLDFALQFFDTTLLPLQGLLNYCIYLRPQVIKYRAEHPDHSAWTCITSVVLER